jgi:hypothetical protein
LLVLDYQSKLAGQVYANESSTETERTGAHQAAAGASKAAHNAMIALLDTSKSAQIPSAARDLIQGEVSRFGLSVDETARQINFAANNFGNNPKGDAIINVASEAIQRLSASLGDADVTTTLKTALAAQSTSHPEHFSRFVRTAGLASLYETRSMQIQNGAEIIASQERHAKSPAMERVFTPV